MSTTSLGPRQQRRLSGSTRRSPIASTPSGAFVARRTSARRRATSTTKLNGLRRKSSAPSSRPSASSCSPCFAVSISTGVRSPSRPQLAAHGVAVEPGQQDVEHDRRVGALRGPPQPVGAGVGEVDLEPLGAQAAGDASARRDLVLDHQHAHLGSVAAARRRHRARGSQRPLSDAHRPLSVRHADASTGHDGQRLSTSRRRALRAARHRLLLAACGGGGGDERRRRRGRQPRRRVARPTTDGRRRPPTTATPSADGRSRGGDARVHRVHARPRRRHARPADVRAGDGRRQAGNAVSPSRATRRRRRSRRPDEACEPLMENVRSDIEVDPERAGRDAGADARVRRVHARPRHRHARPGVRRRRAGDDDGTAARRRARLATRSTPPPRSATRARAGR